MIYTLQVNNTYYKSFQAKVKFCQKIPLQKKSLAKENTGEPSPSPPNRAFYVGVIPFLQQYSKRNILLPAITNTFSVGQRLYNIF